MVRKQQTVRNIVKRLARNSGDLDAVSRTIERHVRMDRPQGEILEELVQCFLAISGLRRQDAVHSDLSPSRLIEAFRSVIREKGIDADKFYALLIERMLVEGNAGDSGSHGQARPAAKERVLEAAFEVFTEKGFHMTTVDEIAERAGVGKGTLYRYFSNKEGLFNELVRLRLAELEENTQTILNGEDDALTMITKYLRIYFEFFDHNQRLYRLIVQEGLDVGGRMEDLYVKKVLRRVPVLKRKIYEASQNGVLKDIDFQTVFFGTMGFVHGVIQKWLAHDCSYSLVEELPAVVEVLFYGFCAKRDLSTEN